MEKTLIFSEKILIKRLLVFVEIISMTINKIAQVVFDSFANTDIVLAILNRNGSYVSNKIEVFEQVFSEGKLLEELRRKIDDGHEPLITQIGEFLVAASALSADFNSMGYVIMLLPASTSSEGSGHSSEKSPEYLDSTGSRQVELIEIILEQFSLIAGLIEQNQQLIEYSETIKTSAELAAFASVN